MRIENPGTVLPLIMLVLLLGMGGCLYVVVRFLRRGSSPEQRPKKTSPAGPPWTKRLTGWLSEPTSAPARPQVAPDERPPASQPGAPAEGESVEVFRVLRVGTLGELVVAVEGQRYRQLVEIQDGVVERRVLLAIQELGEFVGRHGQRPLPEMHRIVGPAAWPAEREPELTDEQQAFLAQLQESPVAEETEETKVDMVGYWRKGLSPARRREVAAAVKMEPKSLVDEMEELLQLRLATHPKLAGRSIHFRSTPAGGLRIEVDGGRYESVDDVPYHDVVTVLKETVKVWEQR